MWARAFHAACEQASAACDLSSALICGRALSGETACISVTVPWPVCLTLSAHLAWTLLTSFETQNVFWGFADSCFKRVKRQKVSQRCRGEKWQRGKPHAAPALTPLTFNSHHWMDSIFQSVCGSPWGNLDQFFYHCGITDWIKLQKLCGWHRQTILRRQLFNSSKLLFNFPHGGIWPHSQLNKNHLILS